MMCFFLPTHKINVHCFEKTKGTNASREKDPQPIWLIFTSSSEIQSFDIIRSSETRDSQPSKSDRRKHGHSSSSATWTWSRLATVTPPAPLLRATAPSPSVAIRTAAIASAATVIVVVASLPAIPVASVIFHPVATATTPWRGCWRSFMFKPAGLPSVAAATAKVSANLLKAGFALLGTISWEVTKLTTSVTFPHG